MQSKNAIVICGPTASGKTGLGVRLCREIGGEVVSADSMQIYTGMDIGTAKVTAEEMCGVPHHMIDIAQPDEDFSVSRWVAMAADICEDIFSRGKIPVIVGGTGLYIDSLLSGRDFAEGSLDGELRRELSAEFDAAGGEKMLLRLKEIDPERAEKLHPADKKRIIRALEIFTLTGETITEHDKKTAALPPRWPSCRFGLCFENREDLYRRIDLRVDIMVENGLFSEVKSLLEEKGLSPSCTAMQAIGYKEAVQYLNGEISREECIDLIKRGSRRYAKRQMTWFRRDTGLEWIKWGSAPDLERGLGQMIDILSSRGII